MRLRRYLLWFAQDYFALDIKPFREAEMQSLSKLFKVPLNIVNNYADGKPFWILETDRDEETICKFVSRSFSLKYALRLWMYAESRPEFHTNLKNLVTHDLNHEIHSIKGSFKVKVETFNKKITQQQKIEKIETLDYLPLTGDVDLTNPKSELVYIEYYGLNFNEPLDEPCVMFGEKVAEGSRNLITELSLKNRKFIGNTSMEPQLAFIMANQGLIEKGSLVFDPFVGSGSILVSAAKLGSFVMGSDIDYLTLHGKSKPTRKYETVRAADESLYANLQQYNCDKLYLDILVSDFSLPIWHESQQFDAIITDPPYGLREATERISFKVSRKDYVYNSDTQHYPSTSNYDLNSLFLDLFNFSVLHLKMNGRLVLWYPVVINDYDIDKLPKHKSLTLVANSLQTLSKLAGRILLTYEKVGTELEDEINLDTANLRQKLFTTDGLTRKERKLQAKQKLIETKLNQNQATD